MLHGTAAFPLQLAVLPKVGSKAPRRNTLSPPVLRRFADVVDVKGAAALVDVPQTQQYQLSPVVCSPSRTILLEREALLRTSSQRCSASGDGAPLPPPSPLRGLGSHLSSHNHLPLSHGYVHSETTPAQCSIRAFVATHRGFASFATYQHLLCV